MTVRRIVIIIALCTASFASSAGHVAAGDVQFMNQAGAIETYPSALPASSASAYRLVERIPPVAPLVESAPLAPAGFQRVTFERAAVQPLTLQPATVQAAPVQAGPVQADTEPRGAVGLPSAADSDEAVHDVVRPSRMRSISLYADRQDDTAETVPPGSQNGETLDIQPVAPDGELIDNIDGLDAGPRWIASVDSLFLSRTRADGRALFITPAFNNPIPNTVLIDVHELDLGTRAGPRVDVIHRGDCGRDVEFEYFQVDNFHANRAAVLQNPLAFVNINNLFGFFLGTMTPVTASYSSRLRSYEVDLRCEASCCMACFAGFRALELNENFLATDFFGDPLETFGSVTSNHLYGGQVGADRVLWRNGQVRLNGLTKLGLYGNSAQQHSFVHLIPTDNVNVDVSKTATDLAFVGEITFTGTAQLSQHVALRGGYELLWIDGVALAPEQIDASNLRLVPPSVGINTHGSVFYNGAFVGLEASW